MGIVSFLKIIKTAILIMDFFMIGNLINANNAFQIVKHVLINIHVHSV
jgi:hypothetical protein